MMYSIIDTEKGRAKGFQPHLHQTVLNGSKMVVNENELRTIDSDAATAAAMLDGTLLTLAELQNEINKYKHYN